nr:MAG TPA: hypothetical protein [Caudoviricetes sp.]
MNYFKPRELKEVFNVGIQKATATQSVFIF